MINGKDAHKIQHICRQLLHRKIILDGNNNNIAQNKGEIGKNARNKKRRICCEKELSCCYVFGDIVETQEMSFRDSKIYSDEQGLAFFQSFFPSIYLSPKLKKSTCCY